jgi:rod shape-determining protein MreD
VILRQSVFVGTSIFVAVIIQLTLLSRLGFAGATPDLVVVTVVALALALGPVPGATAGFAAGVLLDLSPPSDTLIGVNAIIYLVIGFIAGYWVDPRDRTLPIMAAIAALSTGSAALGTAAVDTVLGGSNVNWTEVPWVTLTAAFYGLVLAAAVIPLIGILARRLVPEMSG